MLLVSKRSKGVEHRIDSENHISAATAISTAGPAKGNIFFPPETDHTGSALARTHMNSYFVNKHKCGNYTTVEETGDGAITFANNQRKARFSSCYNRLAL
jgi:hypothetical protein